MIDVDFLPVEAFLLVKSRQAGAKEGVSDDWLFGKLRI